MVVELGRSGMADVGALKGDVVLRYPLSRWSLTAAGGEDRAIRDGLEQVIWNEASDSIGLEVVDRMAHGCPGAAACNFPN